MVNIVSNRTYGELFALYKFLMAEFQEEKSTRPQEVQGNSINEAETDQARLRGLTL
jgi:hypothetical protein